MPPSNKLVSVSAREHGISEQTLYRKAMRRLDLTQQAAAKRMGITQPKVSDMMRGNFTNLSERKLMDCLNRLGYDLEIKVRPTTGPLGHLMFAVA